MIVTVIPHDAQMGDVLDSSLQGLILSFLVHLPTQNGRASDRQATAEAIQNCTLVCKKWRFMVHEIINQPSLLHLPRPVVITASLLSNIKKRVMQLDLKVVRETFLQNVREKWGDVKLNGSKRALQVIVKHTHGGWRSFANAAQEHYRQLLVVKCVETIVARKHPPPLSLCNEDNSTPSSSIDTKPPANAWLEKSVPPQLLRMFWQAHLLHPVKYVQDCQSLICQVIDHQPNDDFDWEYSSLAAKREQLFHFEMATRPTQKVGGEASSSQEIECTVLGDDIFDLDDISVGELGNEIMDL